MPANVIGAPCAFSRNMTMKKEILRSLSNVMYKESTPYPRDKVVLVADGIIFEKMQNGCTLNQFINIVCSG